MVSNLSLVVPPDGDRTLLSNIALFKGLNPQEMNAIEQASRYRRFSRHEQIVDRDAPGTDVYFVVRGRVRVVNYSVSGREITLADLDEGAHFGELSALDGLPRAASVMAIEDSMIVSLPGRIFCELLSTHNWMAMRFIRGLASDLRAANQRVLDLSTVGANERIQAELLRQARGSKRDGNGAVIYPIPIHSDIASRVSTTRETVARVLNDMARKGLIKRTRQGLVVHDLQSLEDMVEAAHG